jgi:hypothetical protein
VDRSFTLDVAFQLKLGSNGNIFCERYSTCIQVTFRIGTVKAIFKFAVFPRINREGETVSSPVAWIVNAWLDSIEARQGRVKRVPKRLRVWRKSKPAFPIWLGLPSRQDDLPHGPAPWWSFICRLKELQALRSVLLAPVRKVHRLFGSESQGRKFLPTRMNLCARPHPPDG